jgi:hypothetical protein
MCWTHHAQDEDKQITKHNTICVGHTMHKTKTNKTKNTTQYVLDTTMHKTQDEDKQNKKHNTICVGHNYAQDTRRRQTKHNTICVGHTMHKTKTNKTQNTTQYVLDTTIHKTQDEDKQNKKSQHNMCWTQLYTRLGKSKQKHNTISVGHHYKQRNTHNVNKTYGFLQSTGGKDEPNIVFMRKS